MRRVLAIALAAGLWGGTSAAVLAAGCSNGDAGSQGHRVSDAVRDRQTKEVAKTVTKIVEKGAKAPTTRLAEVKPTSPGSAATRVGGPLVQLLTGLLDPDVAKGSKELLQRQDHYDRVLELADGKVPAPKK